MVDQVLSSAHGSLVNGVLIGADRLFYLFPDHVCSHHPCLNGGKCVAYGSANGWHYKCNCPLLYRGEHCESKNGNHLIYLFGIHSI